MDRIALTLHSNYHGNTEIGLFPGEEDNENGYLNIPSGQELIYNDNEYTFSVSGLNTIPSKVYINDEAYDVMPIHIDSETIKFRLKDCNSNRPFLNSFGAVKIEIVTNNLTVISKSIKVMVSNTAINNGVMNMIQYIYDKCEDYLYEEHKYSSISTGVKNSEIISLEAKISLLEKIMSTYKQAYHYLKVNPHSKLVKSEKIDSFDKLQSVTPNMIRYTVGHIDELVPVNYNTGIRYNKQFYQPDKTLIEYNSYTADVYENEVIVGFLYTIISDISNVIKDIQSRIYSNTASNASDGYIDSMYQIFSRSIKKINNYTKKLSEYMKSFQELYYYYSKLLRLKGTELKNIPKFTPIFRSVNVYRQIYGIICQWFSCGNYDLGKDQLLLSFVSTSKIYEYYCLVKLLYHLDKNTDFKFIESTRSTYAVRNSYFTNTRCSNTFTFLKDRIKITLYFQPVIYGNDLSMNGIRLFRNTSSNSNGGNTQSDYRIYTPDYLLKIEREDGCEYIIIDAKFSTPDNIRRYQLKELVYKYLFSISPLDSHDSVVGLYILCGKTSGNDEPNIVHDIARRINHSVYPFAELLTMNGTDTNDYNMPEVMFRNIL